MTPEEISVEIEAFKKEVEPLSGNDLLDKWIEFEDSEASKEPDIGLLNSLNLEAALNAEFGEGEWHEKVEERKKFKQA